MSACLLVSTVLGIIWRVWPVAVVALYVSFQNRIFQLLPLYVVAAVTIVLMTLWSMWDKCTEGPATPLPTVLSSFSRPAIVIIGLQIFTFVPGFLTYLRGYGFVIGVSFFFFLFSIFFKVKKQTKTPFHFYPFYSYKITLIT